MTINYFDALPTEIVTMIFSGPKSLQDIESFSIASKSCLKIAKQVADLIGFENISKMYEQVESGNTDKNKISITNKNKTTYLFDKNKTSIKFAFRISGDITVGSVFSHLPVCIEGTNSNGSQWATYDYISLEEAKKTFAEFDGLLKKEATNYRFLGDLK